MKSLFRELPNIAATRDEMKRAREIRYAPFGLQSNPFPLGGNYPEGYLDYTYLEEAHKRRIADFLFTTFERSEFNGLLILGEYGTGKSHLLHYIHNFVLEDPDQIYRGRALAFLIGNPGLAPEDIMLKMLAEIGVGALRDLIFLPVRRRLSSEYGANLMSFLEKFTTFKRQQHFSSNLSDGSAYTPDWYQSLLNTGYREFVDALKTQSIQLDTSAMLEYAKRVLFEEVTEDPIIIDSFSSLVFSRSAEAKSWEAFLLKGFSRKRTRLVGIEYYLEAILRLFEIMGVAHVYLLVDELEDLRTSRLTRTAATEYLAALRRMIQHNYRRFSFVLASARDAWDELKFNYPAIDDRFPETMRIDLARNSQQIKRVLVHYLAQARAEKSDESEDLWYPFTEELIDHVIDSRGRLLRHVLTECRRLLDDAVNSNVSPPLTLESLAQFE